MINCPTCGKIIENPRKGQIYCNQECYSKSSKLKEQAKNSKLIQNNEGNNYHLGYKHSEEIKKIISEKTPKKIAEDNPKWLGDNVGYDALHDWIRANKEFTGKCEICGLESDNRRIIQAANISGEYKRDVNDFTWLCNKCHYKFDNLKRKQLKEVIGVECKVNGYLDKKEKEKCKWLLDNNIFSKILIAYKTKEKNKVKVNYKEFKC